MRVSINQLSELTGKDRRTIKMRLGDLPHEPGPKQSYLYDSRSALQRIYCGETTEDGTGGVTLEQARIKLTLKQATNVDVDTEIKRKQRIPIEVVNEVYDQVFQAQSAILKASKLPTETVNEILAQMRAMPSKLKW